MPLAIGEVAPPIVGTDVVNNQSWSLNDHHKKVLLAFSGITWCGPCMKEAPALEAVWQKHDNIYPPFTMAIISGGFGGNDEDPQKLQEAITDFGITFPVVPGASNWTEYKITGVPTLYCLNWNENSNNHEVCAIHNGASGTTEEITQDILAFLYDCGLSEIVVPNLDKWEATFLVLFGGVGTGGGGIGITPGGKSIPILPRDPLQSLGVAGRDALTGLAVAEMAGQLRDSDSRSRIMMEGLHTAQVAIKKLEKQISESPTHITSGGVFCNVDVDVETQQQMKQKD